MTTYSATCSKKILLTSKPHGLPFVKNKCSFAQIFKFRVFRLQTNFFKACNFFNYSTFSVLLHVLFLYYYFALLSFGDKGVRLSAGPFLRSEILWYVQNFRWVQNSIFPNGKHIFSNSWSLSKWWWWWWWCWIVFVVWLTNEKRLALFPAGTRDPHNCESLTRRK